MTSAELTRSGTVSGHVYRVERSSGPRWYVKHRLPDGRQVQKALGPAWTRGGRPAEGFWTKRLAEAELRRILTEAQNGTRGGMVRTRVTFAQATAEWLRYVREDRAAKASTLHDYRNMVRVLDRALGHMPLEQVTLDVLERWRTAFIAERSPSNRTVHKYLIALNSIFKRSMRAFGLPNNPASLIERPRIRRTKEISVPTAPRSTPSHKRQRPSRTPSST